MEPMIGFCRETELDQLGTGPQWVHLLPKGEIAGRDGRHWRMNDPSAVIAASLDGTDLPVDYEHQMHDPSMRPADGVAPAAGWIKTLEGRADGIWGLVEWTPKALNMVGGREYRYLSPVFHFDQGGKVLRLLGAGLVHQPNLKRTALSARQDRPALADRKPPDAALSLVALALGLPADAAPDSILTAVNGLKVPDPAKYVPVDAVAGLLKEHRATVAVMTEREVEAKVEAAVMSAHISPAMRDWATALCRENPASFDAFLSSSAPMFGHLFERKKAFDRAPGVTGTPARDAAGDIASQLGLDPKRLG